MKIQQNSKAKSQKTQQVTKKIQKDNKFGNFASKKAEQKSKGVDHKDILLANIHKTKKVNRFKDQRLIQQLQQKQTVQNALKYKKSKFDIDSDEENGPLNLKLTHKGKVLEELDDFKENIENSSDDGNVPAELVNKLHFGGFDDKINNFSNQKKSKNEIYDEIIKKSKLMKHEKQRQKEDDQEKIIELDQGFQEFNKLLVYRENQDDYDKLALELEFEEKQYPNLQIVKKENKKEKKLKERKRVQFAAIMSSDEDDKEEQINDDELQNTGKKENIIMKHYRKVEKLNTFMDKIKQIKTNQNMIDDQDDQDSMDEIDLDGDDDDDDENEQDEYDQDDDDQSDQENSEEQGEDQTESEDNENGEDEDEFDLDYENQQQLDLEDEKESEQ